MSHTPNFGDLRSLLNQNHTPQVWDQLCTWISTFDDEASKQRILPYIEGHLLKWSDKERMAPRAWIQSLLNDQPVPWLFITRSISMRGWDRAARRAWRSNTLELKPLSLRQELEHIHFIDLGHNDLHDNELEHLIKSPNLHSLIGLDLQRNALTQDSMALMADSPLRLQLQELSLRQNPIQDEGLAALLSKPWPALKKLDLNGLELKGSALKLLNSQQLPALELLDLGKTAFSPSALKDLELPTLRALLLEQCELKDDGAKLLAAKTSLTDLEQLSLWSCSIQDAGITALLQQQDLSQLKHLNLGKNQLGPSAIHALCKRELPSLTTLNLYGNPLDDDSYKQLANASWLPQLKQLFLGADQASSTGKKALQKSSLLPQDIHLSLS